MIQFKKHNRMPHTKIVFECLNLCIKQDSCISFTPSTQWTKFILIKRKYHIYWHICFISCLKHKHTWAWELLPQAQIFPAGALSCATVKSQPHETCFSLRFSPPLRAPETDGDLDTEEVCKDETRNRHITMCMFRFCKLFVDDIILLL